MAEFLTTFGTSSRIEEIMINAKTEIYLVSPFLQISKTFYERLKEASDNGVNIKIIYGKDKLNTIERDSLANIPKLELYYFDNLHAKCYFNESKMVITSMNMYEFSEKNNREMGVWVDIKNDFELYESAKRETLSILKLAERKLLNKPIVLTETKKEFPNYVNDQLKNYNGARGYCIRCGAPIKLDGTHPYCSGCYRGWSRHGGNPALQEKKCHFCGKKEDSSILKPFCYKCFGNYQRMNGF